MDTSDTHNASIYLYFPSKKSYEPKIENDNNINDDQLEIPNFIPPSTQFNSMSNNNNNNNHKTSVAQVNNPPVVVLDTPPSSQRSTHTTSENSPPPILCQNFRNTPISTNVLHPPQPVKKAQKEISSKIQIENIKPKKKATKEINSNIDKSNIITSSRRRKPVIPSPSQDEINLSISVTVDDSLNNQD